jgi:hypothetical protein
MTADLETSNLELEQRRRTMETILAELTAASSPSARTAASRR